MDNFTAAAHRSLERTDLRIARRYYRAGYGDDAARYRRIAREHAAAAERIEVPAHPLKRRIEP